MLLAHILVLRLSRIETFDLVTEHMAFQPFLGGSLKLGSSQRYNPRTVLHDGS